MKLGFDTSFNPVCELGGRLWGPTGKLFYPIREDIVHEPTPDTNVKDKMTELKMDSRWITDHQDTWFYTGNRLSGMDVAQCRHRVVMNLEMINGKKMWVVDTFQKKGIKTL